MNQKAFIGVIGLILAAVLLLGALATMYYVVQLQERPRKICLENLPKIDAAVEQWALENNQPEGAQVELKNLVATDNYLREMPVCPSGGKYPEILTVGEEPACSIHGSLSQLSAEIEK